MKFTIYKPTADVGVIVSSGSRLVMPQDLTVLHGEDEGILVGVEGDWRTEQVNLTTLELEPIPPVVPTLTELKTAAKAAAAQRRWEVETGGMTFGGAILATDDRSKLLLSAAAAKAQADPSFTAQWKMQDGTWVSLDATSLIAAYQAIFGWVADCFAREEMIGALIDDQDNPEDLASLGPTIQQFWP